AGVQTPAHSAHYDCPIHFCRHPLGAGLATGATLGLIAKGETSVFSGRLDIIIRKFRLFSVWLGILVWRCAIRRRAPGGFSVRLDYAKNSTSRTVLRSATTTSLSPFLKGNHRRQHLSTCLSICRIWQR